jgi:general stress protein 26
MQTSFHFLRLSTGFAARIRLLPTPFVQSAWAAVIPLRSFRTNAMAQCDALYGELHPMFWRFTMTEALSRPQAIEKLAELIKDIRIAMLSTVAADGSIHSRPMATQDAEFTGELLFLTRQDSSKTDEITQHARVTLNYVDAKSYRFITLSGRASLSKDRETIHKLWSPLYKAWFPEGEGDPEITVIRVEVDHAEYWEAPSNAVVRGFQLLKAAVSKGSSSVGEHEQVSLQGSHTA